MKKFLSLMPTAALFLSAAPLSWAQSLSSANQPAVQSAPAGMAQAESVYTSEEKNQYFSLEHRAPGQLDPDDADLLKRRHRDVLAEAEFYGYDMSAGSWAYEQAVCAQMPDYVMLRYTSKDAAGADSIFTALVPRKSGRIWIVPVLTHGATQFRPAPTDPRNYQVFAQAIPADAARQASSPDGKWLTLSVCYAEMTGARPQVPNRPELEPHMTNAPSPSLRISAGGKEKGVRFTDPISQTDYRLWDITYDDAGRILRASNEERSFTQPAAVTHPIEPVAKLLPKPPDSPELVVIHPAVEPVAKLLPNPPDSPQGVVRQPVEPVARLLPNPPDSPQGIVRYYPVEPVAKLLPNPPDSPQGVVRQPVEPVAKLLPKPPDPPQPKVRNAPGNQSPQPQ